uniref:NADH dehydrogenase subunit 4 n=1 Tax=Paraschizogynium plumachela TaxID=3109024 RepID=UPI002E786372|nr:NADH dehydrogenase subunit 4 [Paraschizogynium plumachela]WQM21758.1 NADH dehydrogenase subunit 4 [Paraschizogynium plumachela]
MLKYIIVLMLSLLLMDNYLWVVMIVTMMMIMSFMLVYSGESVKYLDMFFYMDNLSYLMVLLMLWLSFMMMMSMINVLGVYTYMFKLWSIMMMLFLLCCFSVMNLLSFYVFFESVLLPIVLIIFGWGNQGERVSAGIYMLMYTLVGSLPLLVMILLLGYNGSLSYLFLKWEMFNLSGFLSLFLLLAFLVKMPMYGFHLWLPKAHVEAPVAGSMILAGVLLKMGGYGLYRFLGMINSLSMYLSMILGVSIWGGVIVGLMCMRQLDLKMLIAYSSVCHMGLVLGGLVSKGYYGGYGMLIMMLGHGLCSSGLFFLGNIMYERFHSRNMMVMKGLGNTFPSLMLWWFLMSVINMGAPPFMNLIGEISLIVGIMKISNFSIMFLGLMSFLGACYSLYMYSYMQHGSLGNFFSGEKVVMREYYVIMMHFLPLLMYVIKMDVVYML